MKKAAIVTLFHNNYNFGGQLQAYALQKFISNYDIDCEVIDYDSQNKFKKIKALTFSTIFSRFYHKLQMKTHMILDKKLKNEFDKKNKLFREFMMMIPHTSIYTNETAGELSDRYYYWITGSDQVWNPEAFTGGELYLLNGMNGVKISYATSSFNARFTKDQAELLKQSLSDYKAISVREFGLSKVLSKITGRTISTVLDPTLLLEAKEWDKIAVKPSIDKKYAFVYLVHISDEVRKNIFDYCKRHSLLMVIVPHSQGWYKSADEKYYDIQAADIGPREWIGYIKYADIVFTDSFHGTVFSVNYHKKFISFENLTGEERKDMGLRKYSFLKSISLDKRCVPYSFDLEREITGAEIVYTQADALLRDRRKASEDFLNKALEIK